MDTTTPQTDQKPPEAAATTAQPGTDSTPKEDEKKPANGKPPRIEKHRYTDTLAVPLSNSELIERSQLAARLLSERDQLEEKLKADSSSQKAVIKEKEAAFRRISKEVEQGRTFKPVDCERVYNYTTGYVTEIRLDTGKEIGTKRRMNHDEQQRSLGFDATKAAADKAKDKGKGKPADAKQDPDAAQPAKPAAEKPAPSPGAVSPADVRRKAKAAKKTEKKAPAAKRSRKAK